MRPYFLIFLYGVFAACFALILELILFGVLPLGFFGFLDAAPAYGLSFFPFLGLFFFALAEEGSRALFLLRYQKNISQGTLPSLEGRFLLPGIAFGGGFAGLEVLASTLFDNTPPDSFLPGSILLHVFLSIGMALLVFRGRGSKVIFGILFALAVTLHLLYNIFMLLF